MCFCEQAKEGTRSGIQRYTPTRGGGQVVLGVDSGTLQVWDQHSGRCGVRNERSRRGCQLNVCGRDNHSDLVSTSVDRIDRALGKTKVMERVGGSLLDVTVSDDSETPGRGEDLFVLPLHFVNPESRPLYLPGVITARGVEQRNCTAPSREYLALSLASRSGFKRKL
jgi:hypothetical protein